MSKFPNWQLEPGTIYSVPPDFDHISQPMFFLRKNGTLDAPFDFHRLDYELSSASQWCIVYGCLIGAAVMTLLHVLALTPLTKRRTLIYWLNVIGLCEVLARGVFQALYFTRDKFETFYVLLSGDSTSVPPLHRVHSTFNVILSLSCIATVEIIFFVQGRAILSSLPRNVYLALMSILVFFGMAAITMRLIYAVYNVQDIWVWNHIARDTNLIPRWVEPLSKFFCNSTQGGD
jgi:Fungal pheromone mating factor STE2 GPCR